MKAHHLPSKLEVLQYYSNKFKKIRVDNSRGFAPHKPILLFSIIEMIRKGEIPENEIYLSQELNNKFLKYWSYLGSEAHNPDISRPYFHMKSGKFWHFIANPGYEKVITSKTKLKTLAEVKRTIRYAYFDEDLFDFLKDEKYRESLLSVLVGRWFPGQLYEIIAISETDNFRNPPIAMEKIEARLKAEMFP
ncbi:hypothetical protein [Leptolyngbya iicbica]|uniref:Uncharacterized protein n=2 Tax=Cyanophyceae TaxID=3028117 RepID=A0A4Q7ED37_9CYAN|nr:hypothetical protein [Leptolyngbya sp. LK]RZM79145.1 hypothetical protein DYY88_10325 [Leptolyngbya sp. LK]